MTKRSERRAEFQRHVDDIRSDYEKRLKAVYVLYPEFVSSSADGDSQKTGIGFNITKVMRGLIEKHLDERFNLDIMAKWIFESHPTEAGTIKKIAISNTLTRLARRGEIEIISEAGARPTVYMQRKKQIDRKISAV